jgi:hypothetical protein
VSETLLAIDPGNTHSAYAVFEAGRLTKHGKLPNDLMADLIEVNRRFTDHMAIEMIASYGMAVSATVFDTCVWIGRFTQAFGADKVTQIKRMDVKMHLCHDSRAKDANIRAALIDRFGEPGTKKNPGILYGVKADIWAAIAVGVTWLDNQPVPFSE